MKKCREKNAIHILQTFAKKLKKENNAEKQKRKIIFGVKDKIFNLKIF